MIGHRLRRTGGRAPVRPIVRTAEVIAGVDEKHLDQRLPAEKLPTELRPMAERINEMLARLERSFVQRKRFLADAAHELRTPVAALHTSLEVASLRPREPASLARTIQDCLGQTRFLKVPFYRGDLARSAADVKSDHLGLGLAIVRSHAEALGGSCSVSGGADGQGAVFVVNLPVTIERTATKIPERVS